MTDAAPSPASVDPDDVGPGSGPRRRISRWQKAVGAAGLVIVLWVGYDSTLVRAWFDDSERMDHMPDGMDHGPAGEMEDDPVDDAPPPDPAEGGEPLPPDGADVEDGDHAPPSDPEDMHDPSQWDH